MGLDNSRFSSLVYRIIGKPDRWHHDYIDIMHQVLDETDAIDAPENLNELKIGDQILNRISNTNEAMLAFGTLLDKSRFKMIILDDSLNMVYHNENAKLLRTHLQHPKNSNKLCAHAFNKVSQAALQNKDLFQQGSHDGLSSIDYFDQNQEQIYLRSIHKRDEIDATVSTHHLLLVVDQASANKALNPEFVERYDLTEKEQSVLIYLIHGKGIKQIAASSFVSENTIKTHLKALFRKTDTRSQADILRLVLTHESQILDSYFGSKEPLVENLSSEASTDKFMTLSSGLRVAYREYGPTNGHPIIVCHNGYGCRVTIPRGYQEMCQRQNKRIIIPDRPGYGLTPLDGGEPQDWNSELSEFIDRLEIDSYDLLGSVLGSVIALNYAAQADERLRKVRLSSPVFVNYSDDSDYLNGIFAPVTRLIRASRRFTLEIYRLWLKSVTINLSLHYRKMLENGFGVAERKIFGNDNTIELMIEGFQQGSSKGIEGIAREMVYCLSPKKIDLASINVPVELWWGSEDNRISLKGVENIAKQLPYAKIHMREGYSEYIYYALFEDIIS